MPFFGNLKFKMSLFYFPSIKVMFLLKREVSINAQDDSGQTALHAAQVAPHGHAEVTDILLAHRADVTVQDNLGNTALHKAILNLIGLQSTNTVNGEFSVNSHCNALTSG